MQCTHRAAVHASLREAGAQHAAADMRRVEAAAGLLAEQPLCRLLQLPGHRACRRAVRRDAVRLCSHRYHGSPVGLRTGSFLAPTSLAHGAPACDDAACAVGKPRGRLGQADGPHQAAAAYWPHQLKQCHVVVECVEVVEGVLVDARYNAPAARQRRSGTACPGRLPTAWGPRSCGM